MFASVADSAWPKTASRWNRSCSARSSPQAPTHQKTIILVTHATMEDSVRKAVACHQEEGYLDRMNRRSSASSDRRMGGWRFVRI